MTEKELVTQAQQMPEKALVIARQLKLMISNGQKLSTEEVMTLAMFAYREGLDPLNGECWILKRKDGTVIGCAVGIKGLRRKATEALGYEDVWYPEYKDITMSYDLNDKEILYAYECIIRNTRATARWLQMHEEAKGLNFTSEQTIEAFGHPPVWRGVGVVHKSEYISPTYPQTTRCKKRAEAAAINAMMGFGYEIFDEDQRQPIEVTQIEEPADTEVTDAEFKTVVEPAINVEVTEPVKVKPANEVRPFSSERLGEVIAAKAEKYRKVNQEASDNERKKLIATLNQLTQGDDNLRHSLTNYLCGVESTKDLDSGNVLALLEWLKPTTDSGGAWVLDGMAVKEYLRIHEEVFSVGVG